jgi:hypothetical protein
MFETAAGNAFPAFWKYKPMLLLLAEEGEIRIAWPVIAESR